MSGTAWQPMGAPTNPPVAPFDGVPVLVTDGDAISIAVFVPAYTVVNAVFTMKQIDGSWTVVPAAPASFPDSWRVMEDGKLVTDAEGNYVTVVPVGWQPAPEAAFTPPAG